MPTCLDTDEKLVQYLVDRMRENYELFVERFSEIARDLGLTLDEFYEGTTYGYEGFVRSAVVHGKFAGFLVEAPAKFKLARTTYYAWLFHQRVNCLIGISCANSNSHNYYLGQPFIVNSEQYDPGSSACNLRVNGTGNTIQTKDWFLPRDNFEKYAKELVEGNGRERITEFLGILIGETMNDLF